MLTAELERNVLDEPQILKSNEHERYLIRLQLTSGEHF